MIKKVYSKLKSEGLRGLLTAIYHRVLPPRTDRLGYYECCKSYFQSRIGLEIGGPSAIFRTAGCIPVYPDAARIDNCNFGSHNVWDGTVRQGDTFVFDKGKAAGHQFIAEASNLNCIENSAYDFVLSSHCIEHLANPLQGLTEWIRVLKPDGLLVLVTPHKDGTFDHRRQTTTLKHLIQDFDAATTEDDLTHLDEILRFHDLTQDPGAGDFQAFQERSKRNVEHRCLHHHVFDTRLVVEMANYLGLQILTVELFQPYNIVLIAKKTLHPHAINNSRYRGIDSAPIWSSPFPSDRTAAGESL